jgi:hypothetical protein
MPLPRKKDAGSSGAPVLNILRAHVKLTDVEEHTEPFTVTRKSDGATFTLDPQFKCIVEVIDDGQGGDDNGARFFEGFRYKQDKNGYFEDDSIPELEASDLEGFEMSCSIQPSRNPKGAITGSTIVWDTMQPLPRKETVATAGAEEEDDFSDIPF